MEYHQAMASDVMMINLNDNNNNSLNHYQHHRQKNDATKNHTLRSLSSSSKTRQIKAISMINPITYQERNSISNQRHQQKLSMKNSLSWKKRWSSWFSSCGSERNAYVKCNPITVAIEVRCYLLFSCTFDDYTCCSKVIDCLIQ